MTHGEQTVLFQFCIALGLLLATAGYLYRRTRVDAFREDLFTIRDNLFDYMWKNDLPYDLPAYRLTRLQLNGMIRIADRVHMLAFAAAVYHMYCRYFSGQETKTLEIVQAIEDIEDSEHRHHFKGVHKRIASRLVHFVFLEGVGWIIFQPLRLAHSWLSAFEFCYDFLHETTEDWSTKQLVKLGANKEMARRVLGREPRLKPESRGGLL